jgi:predicted RNA methylase
MENNIKTGIHANETTSINNYFHFYSKLLNQQNMLQDLNRTNAYFTAVRSNLEDFVDKKVMDFGTGSGVLAMFAASAGAKKVYAIEASDACRYAKKLFEYHNFKNKVVYMFY